MVIGLFILLLIFVQTVFGVGIVLRNPRHQLNQLFGMFVFSLNAWIAANFLENEPLLVGVQAVPFFLRLDFALAPVLFYFLLRFSATFVGHGTESARFARVRLIMILTTLPAVFSPFFDGSLLTDIQFSYDVVRFGNGPLMPYYAVLITAYITSALVILWRGLRAAKRENNPLKQHQIRFILAGAGLSLGIAVAVNLLQTALPIGLALSHVGLFGMIFLVTGTAYAMVRARFFEIKIIIVRAVTFLLLSLVLAGCYAFVLFLIAKDVFILPIDNRLIVAAVCIVVLMTMSFDFLRDRFSRVTERFFFKSRYDPSAVLSQISRSLIETNDLGEMRKAICEILVSQLRMQKAAVVLTEERENVEWFGTERERIPAKLIESVSESDTLVAYDEMPDGQAKSAFRDSEIAVAVPLRIKESHVGILFLGRKLSGEPFDDDDRSFLNIAAPEIAIGIQNAKSFEQVMRFSQELEIRVKERTKELEKSQAQELTRAQEVVKLKDEFVFFAVHELRAPIMAIRGLVELSQSSGESFPESIRKKLDSISDASEHMNQLVNDLLEIARSESDGLKIEVLPQDAKSIIEQVLHEVAPLTEKRHLRMFVQIGEIPRVLCDPEKVREVFLNLISNAIKYNREGGEIYVTALRQKDAGNVVFEVRETGYGIPKDQQEKIFQKFFRAASSDTQNVFGTGLGLFITRMLVEKMGGSVMFSSVEHEGTTFAFTLPIAA